jgi:hypothetical protein
MAENSLDRRIAARVSTLLRFEWGSSSSALYTSASSPITVSGGVLAGTYLPEPSLVATLSQRTGSIDDQPGKIVIRSSRAPVPDLLSGFAFPRVAVVIAAVDPSDPTTARVRQRGWLDVGVRADQGASGLASFDIVGVKSLLKDFPLGVFTSPTCEKIFGSPFCGVDLTGLSASGTISAVGATATNEISIAWTGTPPDFSEAVRWRRGYVEILGGLRIQIRDVLDESPSKVRLTRIPRPTWVGETVVVVPGCEKTQAACAYWDNLANHYALGATIPAYNPSASSE